MNNDDFEQLCVKIKGVVPGFEVRYKDERLSQQVLGKVAFFNPDYMTRYTSTFKDKVYFPSKAFVERDRFAAFKILAHEFVHVLDWGEAKSLFSALYALPQLLAVFAVVALLAIPFSNWFLLALISLVALGPWPSHGRVWFERRGYAMGLAINMWRHGSIHPKKRLRLQAIFTGKNYYWMSRDKKAVDRYIDEVIALSVDDKNGREKTLFNWSPAFGVVHRILTGIESGQ